MEDLLRAQIHENCKLALPEGLKELMSDISREVLRAQPEDLYDFIANYLGALLEARETLSIACQVCSDLCKCTCDSIKPELYQELKKIGFDEENIENAIEVIEKHLTGDQKVKEQSLLLKLLRKTNINETQLPAIQDAIQKAFKRYNLDQRSPMEFRNENKKETTFVDHTLQLHKKNKMKEQNETEDIFVAPDFKPCVTTVSSTSLAGSYVHLPKYQPYSAHEQENLSVIAEKERLSIDYTKVPTITKIKSKNTKINSDNVTDLDENYKVFVNFDNDNHQDEENNGEPLCIHDITEATTSMGSKLNRIKISDDITVQVIDDPEKYSVHHSYHQEDDLIQGYSDDEVEELIENVDSENESCVSSITELLQKNFDDTNVDDEV